VTGRPDREHGVDGRAAPLVTVVGEALIDLVPGGAPHGYEARVGGSPFNVAVGLARLGSRTALMARLGDSAFGRMLRAAAAGEGIALGAAPRAAEPATLAVVSLDEDAGASYDFYREGTADWQWTPAELAALPAATAVLHFGSLASFLAPGGEHVHALARELHARGDVLVSYDPNVRPAVLGPRAGARAVVERGVRHAHVVKASADDVAWLYPGATLDEVGRRWNALGAPLVVLTDGPDGAIALRAGAEALRRPGRTVTVVDTIGAGAAFTAGLLAGLVRRGIHAPARVGELDDGTLGAVVDEAVAVSALTCERVGADPPRLSESGLADLVA
jgi:fructokinase